MDANRMGFGVPTTFIQTTSNETPALLKEADKKNQKLFVCDVFNCEAAFKTKFSLKRHYKKHYQKKSIKCKYCPKHFSLPQYLEEHEHTHTGLKPYACNLCPLKFRQRGKLSHHKRAFHGDSNKNQTSVNELENNLQELQNHQMQAQL